MIFDVTTFLLYLFVLVGFGQLWMQMYGTFQPLNQSHQHSQSLI